MIREDLMDRMTSSEFATWMAFHRVGLPAAEGDREAEGKLAWADFLHFAKGRE